MTRTRLLVVLAAASAVMACGGSAPSSKVRGAAGVGGPASGATTGNGGTSAGAVGAAGAAGAAGAGGAGTGGATAGTSAATTGVGGATAGSGGSGGGAGRADTSDGGGGDSGSPRIDGASDVSSTCGGDPLGAWVVTDEHVPPDSPPASVSSCLDLKLTRNPDGTFGASTWHPRHPALRELGIVFTSASYTAQEMRRGPVTVSYAAGCLASASAGTPTCGQLRDALDVYGTTDGFLGAACTARAAGGCDCTLSIMYFAGSSGTWSASGGLLRLQQGLATSVDTTFCADAGSLRFGSSLDQLLSDWSAFTFTPVDCADGKQSVLEENIDCGKVCGKACQ